MQFDIDRPVPYLVSIYHDDNGPGRILVNSNVSVHEFLDPDDAFATSQVASSGLVNNARGSLVYRAELVSTQFGGFHVSLMAYQFESTIVYTIYIIPDSLLDTFTPMLETTFASIGAGS